MVQENVTQMLDKLSKERVSEVLMKGLKAGGDFLRDKTKENLQSADFRVNDTMLKKVKSIQDKATEEEIVSIFGSHLLRWMEKGTTERFTKKTKAYRGKVRARNFFLNTRTMYESQVIQKIIETIDSELNK